ncbi:hypothetical protein KIL84_007683 [Mauremys mutica]|uniref:Uncharacterized protein n=1 Tax=Mauremys mutica TaxID=74926 RepID=A0A9D4AXA4_9SAUR|nr:hypothetical protein KIL84_007683 [Mauremys mutica]
MIGSWLCWRRRCCCGCPHGLGPDREKSMDSFAKWWLGEKGLTRLAEGAGEAGLWGDSRRASVVCEESPGAGWLWSWGTAWVWIYRGRRGLNGPDLQVLGKERLGRGDSSLCRRRC